MRQALDFDYLYTSNSELKKIKKNFLDKYDLQLESFRNINDKNVLILALFVK